MIFENNYAWAGTTAIIYNLEVDHDFLGFYIWLSTSGSIGSTVVTMLPEDTLIEEFGIEHKQESDNEWTQYVVLNTEQINLIKSKTRSVEQIIDSIKNKNVNYVISSSKTVQAYNYMAPIRIVLKNLNQGTTYNIRSYYTINGEKHYYNECSSTTMIRNDIYYECTEVTGGNETQNEQLRSRINEGCEIYNAMTNFSRATAPSDNLGSKTGGQFKGTYDPTLYQQGAAAHSGMYFASSNPSVSTVCHEMAHNVMKNQIDERESEQAYNKIIKFMEFATHSHKATWRWQSGHNYPVISSASYTDAYNYIVAAATQVCRDASNIL